MSKTEAYTLGELGNRIQREISELGTANAVARKYGISSAHLYNAMIGIDSPTLRKAMNAPKRLPRIRLSIDVPNRDIIEAFDRARGCMSRAQYLQHLMQQGMQ